MPNWKKDDFKPIIEKALKVSSADHATVVINGFEEGATRFANSEINQNVVSGDLTFTARVAFGKSVGSASTNILDDDAVAACVKKAEEIARLTPRIPSSCRQCPLLRYRPWTHGPMRRCSSQRAIGQRLLQRFCLKRTGYI